MTSTYQSALTVIGRLSQPSKMPCLAWSLPPTACKTGFKLRATDPDSVCAICYARRGHYARPTAKAAQQRRLDKLNQALDSYRDFNRFTVAFAHVLDENLRRWEVGQVHCFDHRYFRWFDSGDLQSSRHAKLIREIAYRTPGVQHLLPTRELGIVAKLNDVPDNLTIRVSLPKVNQLTGDTSGLPYSVVVSNADKLPRRITICQAYTRDSHKCGPCRTCWSREVQRVAYWRH